MDAGELFEVLAKGFMVGETQAEREDYKKRLRDAGFAFDLYQSQMNTNTKHKKIKLILIESFKKLEYDVYTVIALFLPYKDVINFMTGEKKIYEKLSQRNHFWNEKFKLEFLKFKIEYEEEESTIEEKFDIFPTSLKVPFGYLSKELESVFHYVPITKTEDWEKIYKNIDSFMKTRYFLKFVYDINKTYPFEATIGLRNIDRMRTLSRNYLLRIGGLADIVFTIGNEAFVVALMIKYRANCLFPYIENNRFSFDYRLLLKWLELRSSGLTALIRYTINNDIYKFKRRSFILGVIKKLKLSINLSELVDGYLFIRGDEEVMKILIERDPRNIRYLTNMAMKNDPNFAIKIVKEDPLLYEYLGPNIRNYNEGIAKYVLSQNGTLLKFAGPLIQDNIYLVGIAVNNNPYALEYASIRIRNDPKFMFWVFGEYGEFLFLELGPKLRNDPEFLKNVAIQIHPEIFEEVGEILQKDKGFCLDMLKIGGMDYFSEYFKNDKEYIWNAFLIDQEVLYKIGDGLQNDPVFLLKLLKRYNGEFRRTLLGGYGAFKNKLFVLEVVKIDVNLLDITKFHNDYEVIVEAIEKDPIAINYAHTDLLNEHPHLFLLAFRKKPELFNYWVGFLSKEIIEDLLKTKHWKLFLSELPERKLVNNHFIILTALQHHGIWAMEYAPDDLKKDLEFMEKAIKINKEAIKYADPSIM